MIFDIIHHTSRIARSIGWLTLKLVCSERELRAAIKTAQEQGFHVHIVGQNVFTKLPVTTGPTITLGTAKPGRYKIAHYTDPHWGSKHSSKQGQIDFLRFAWSEGCRVVAATGDNTDGVKPLLVPEQRVTGADEQIDEGVQIWKRVVKIGCPFSIAAISGNHDGYSSHAIGSDIGRLTEERMQAEGIDWHHAGTCIGNAVLHGARTHLWHPMGAASTTNAIRRMLNNKAEKLDVPTDLILSGHLHHYAAFHAAAEDIYCAAGGTFQMKRYEFANRITGPWDVGGSILTFTVDRRGRACEFSSKFYPIVQR